MLTPLDLSHGVAATNALRSIAEQLEKQAVEERRKHHFAPKPDAMAEARLSVSKEAQESRAKIISAMLSNQHMSTNELVMGLADKVAEHLGIDTSKERSYLMLGKIIGDLVEKMDSGTRKALEEAVGLDTLGISIATFASALRDPTGAARMRLDEALLRTAGRGGVTEATSRIVARLEDAADPRSLEEIKARDQVDDPARPKDAIGQREQLEALKAAKAVDNLEEVEQVQERLAARTEENVDGEQRPGETGDVLMLLAALTETPEEAGLATEALSEDEKQKAETAQASASAGDPSLAASDAVGMDPATRLFRRYL